MPITVPKRDKRAKKASNSSANHYAILASLHVRERGTLEACHCRRWSRAEIAREYTPARIKALQDRVQALSQYDDAPRVKWNV